MSKEKDFAEAYSQSARPESRKKNVQGTGSGLTRRERVDTSDRWLTNEVRPNQYGQFADTPKKKKGGKK